jgi:hypothetical protein
MAETTFARSVMPDGLDDVDVASLQVKYLDGKHFNPR